MGYGSVKRGYVGFNVTFLKKVTQEGVEEKDQPWGMPCQRYRRAAWGEWWGKGGECDKVVSRTAHSMGSYP